jgi:transposase InsO family protein
MSAEIEYLRQLANKLERLEEVTDFAWTLIANAYGGDWENAPDDWVAGAERWREAYHETFPHSSCKDEVPLDAAVGIRSPQWNADILTG